MRDEQTKYRAQGVQTFGVNHAGVEDHERYAAKFRFDFPLLSDPGRAVAVAYNCWREGWRGTQRTVYLIGTDGRVRFGRRGMPGADQILRALR